MGRILIWHIRRGLLADLALVLCMIVDNMLIHHGDLLRRQSIHQARNPGYCKQDGKQPPLHSPTPLLHVSPGETPRTFKTSSGFILSLELDEMNMSKFSPMYRAPIWDESMSGDEGDFDEDWRLMNCLNFVFLPKGFNSRGEMDALYNWHVRRFYHSNGYRLRFAKRLWQHRGSLGHLLKNLPRVVQATRYFNASQAELEATTQAFRPHPRQPRNLQPTALPFLVETLSAARKHGENT